MIITDLHSAYEFRDSRGTRACLIERRSDGRRIGEAWSSVHQFRFFPQYGQDFSADELADLAELLRAAAKRPTPAVVQP